MVKSIRILAILVGLVMGCMGCGATDVGDQDTDTTPVGEDYYPMAVGNSWTYLETFDMGGSEHLFYEVTGIETVDLPYGDLGQQELFALENTFADTPLEKRIQFIGDDGVRADRLQHLIWDRDGVLTKQRDFVPGFLRFDRQKVSVGEQWSESVDRFTDLKDGTAVVQSTVIYQYEIIAADEPVTVPAGTFECLKVKRTVTVGTDPEEKIYFFAKGIGKVKEVTTGLKMEELTSVQISP